LAEAFVIGQAVTGIDADTLVHVSRSGLLDSALHAPQAGFGDTDSYPTLAEKAAVLCVRVALNHPLPDGNKRLAWMTAVMFLDPNGASLHVSDDEAVATVLDVAAGNMNEQQLTEWIERHLTT